MTPRYPAVVSLTMEWVNKVHSTQPDPPLDLYEACELLGIRLLEEDLPYYLDGFRFRTSRGTPHIVVNRTVYKPVGRKRFSIAHEIGHACLCELIDVGAIAIQETASDQARMEWICDHFAGCLLMPEEPFRALWHEYRAKPVGRLAIIANRFEVSIEAAKVRAAHLELGGSQWQHPQQEQ